jgi:hypothetical protein
VGILQRVHPGRAISARQKLGRAWEHIGVLEQVITEFNDSVPYRLRVERDVEASRQLFYLTLDPVDEQLFNRVALLIGDTLGNARSALDHLAFALVEKWATKPLRPERDVAFPLCSNEHSYSKRVTKCLPGVPSGALDIVKRYQPYRRIDSVRRDRMTRSDLIFPNINYGPLWALSELVNIDKHRHVHTVVVRVGGKMFVISDGISLCHPKTLDEVAADHVNPERLEPGIEAHLATIRLNRSDLDADVEFCPTISIAIADIIDPAQPAPTALTSILWSVQDVIRGLEPFL